ncbi:ABC transporter ATP-binding protein [Clostridium vincentii]|uniref:Putative ABC transporter ATP-binding protein YbbL n=1 Tax=Clostridium vincentii TaxID=52704 RepID=A0A2T0BE44_9CLOT|nr:ATP-binding cassette domain-containing protein [Clostridium vincentii]PRR82145.1 putative ABC transporter ATP-binding protein YbbL [Clostridium vincentii]
MQILNIKGIFYEVDNNKILNNINIDVEGGDCISIVGSSGCGKSTLLKICADLISISKGDIYYRGKNYKECNPLDLRRNISYCIQSPHLFGEQVFENLEFPFKIRKESTNKNRISALLERFNLDKGILDKDIHSLSGGEKQRIAIARNLMYIPDILLLDESTSALDTVNAQVVEEYIKDINKEGVTVIWVTHSLEQSEGIFNKRITISNGSIEKVEGIR